MPRVMRGGRGRGRGRGGRGRRGRFAGRRGNNAPKPKVEEEDLDIMTDVKGFFLGTAKSEAHFKAQEEHRNRYVAAMCLMSELNMEISQSE